MSHFLLERIEFRGAGQILSCMDSGALLKAHNTISTGRKVACSSAAVRLVNGHTVPTVIVSRNRNLLPNEGLTEDGEIIEIISIEVDGGKYIFATR